MAVPQMADSQRPSILHSPRGLSQPRADQVVEEKHLAGARAWCGRGRLSTSGAAVQPRAVRPCLAALAGIRCGGGPQISATPAAAG
jgi:hypothetical protein